MNIFKLKKNKAVIENSRNCTTCRQCINVEGVELGKIKDNYIFTIESIGVYKSQDIFLRALDILEEKSKTYLLWLINYYKILLSYVNHFTSNLSILKYKS